METETITTPDYPRGVTFEQVWAALKKSEEDFNLRLKKLEEEREKREEERQKREEEREKREEEERKKREAERKEREAERKEREAERKKEEEEREKREEEERKKREAEREKEEEERKKREAEREKREAERNRQFEATDRYLKRIGKQMGDLHQRFGKLAEHLVVPNIHKRFNELGYHFGGAFPGGLKIFDEQGKTKAEIDLLLENGNTLMALEVKVKPAIKDVESHIKRLEILRDHRRKLNDSRKIQGAIAGAIFGNEEKKATVEAGLYVIEQTGDTMKIDVPEGFVPKDF